MDEFTRIEGAILLKGSIEENKKTAAFIDYLNDIDACYEDGDEFDENGNDLTTVDFNFVGSEVEFQLYLKKMNDNIIDATVDFYGDNGISRMRFDEKTQKWEYYDSVFCKRGEKRDDRLWNILKKHWGHKVEIAFYGPEDDPKKITLEDMDTLEVILDASLSTIINRSEM